MFTPPKHLSIPPPNFKFLEITLHASGSVCYRYATEYDIFVTQTFRSFPAKIRMFFRVQQVNIFDK